MSVIFFFKSVYELLENITNSGPNNLLVNAMTKLLIILRSVVMTGGIYGAILSSILDFQKPVVD